MRSVFEIKIVRNLYHSVLAGKFKFLEPLYAFIINFEIGLEHVLDHMQRKAQLIEQDLVNNHLTVLIKTFERPTLLKRLVTSIKERYPNLRIIVVDDSNSPCQINGVETIIMPYDSGVSAGRNQGLFHVKTKYILILDDDFVFYRHTNLESVISIMENTPQIDIMGGEVIYLPFFSKLDYSKGNNLFPTEAAATMPRGSFIGDFPVYDKVANFYVARTERIKLVGWDNNLKRIDHADFFTRAKGVLTTVFNSNLKCLHAQNPFDTNYMNKRNDFSLDRIRLNIKYYKKNN
jgi:glycosyltransferase involved in cell wall biosynthesis